MTAKSKRSASDGKRRSPFLKGGEFKKDADKANRRQTDAPSLSETDWADLSPKRREKRQRA